MLIKKMKTIIIIAMIAETRIVKAVIINKNKNILFLFIFNKFNTKRNLFAFFSTSNLNVICNHYCNNYACNDD
jgi:hypothetical protein